MINSYDNLYNLKVNISENTIEEQSYLDLMETIS